MYTGIARVLVRVGAREHLRVQPRQHAGEHARGHPLEVAHAHPRDHLADAPAHVVGAVVGRAAQPEAEVLVDVAQQPRARDHPRLVGRAGEEDARGPRHQRLVEVEERRGATPAASGRGTAAPRGPCRCRRPRSPAPPCARPLPLDLEDHRVALPAAGADRGAAEPAAAAAQLEHAGCRGCARRRRRSGVRARRRRR